MRHDLTRERLLELLREIARRAPRSGGPFDLFLVGGGTAVWAGWRDSSIDADLFTTHEVLLRDVQSIKERLNVNVELVRPEHFVPPLAGADRRHVFLESFGPVRVHHYDPYSQVFGKIVRGFARDLDDAEGFVESGLVDPVRLVELVSDLPDSAFAKYPRLSPAAVRRAVADFVEDPAER